MFFKKRKFFKQSRFNNKIFFENIFIEINKNYLYFKKSELFFSLFLYKKIVIYLNKNYLKIFCLNCNKKEKFLIGTYYSIINNIILGFKEKFIKKLLLVGIGYKAILIYNFLYLYLGFSHPIVYKIPKDIELKIFSFNEIFITGINKQKVFQIASIIRNFKKPDVYKGKGIRYLNEVLKFKEIKKK